jgi:molybdate transport system ATP-binding protein
MSIDIDVRTQRAAFLLDARFHVEGAGVTALYGPSGAGKSSIVNIVAGLLKPNSGTVAINGHTVLDTRANVDVPARRRRVGYVFQDARLFPHMSVENNLLFGWRRAQKKSSARDISAIVEMLGIARLRRRSPKGLSGGEKQRVAIGRALLASPEILLLDEPLASLDLARREEILPYLERLRDERRLPIVYVSHAIEEVARLADNVVVLNEGRVVDQGSVFELIPRLDPKAGVVLPVVVARHRNDGLSELTFGGGKLLVQRIDAREGAHLRVRIAAADVMIATVEPSGISANNVIAVTLAGLRAVPNDLVDVDVVAGSVRLVARITASSASRLALREGQSLFAVIKAVTVDAVMKPAG